MQSMNQSLAALVVHGAVSWDTALDASSTPGDLDLILRKLLYAAGNGGASEEDSMAEPLSDFSKILELQEIKKLYDELQEKSRHDLDERDDEIRRLREELDGRSQSAEQGDGETARLSEENERLTHQIQVIRQEYDAKIERLNSRLREFTGSPSSAAPPAEERRGFFRR